jgi:hypothetical protein
MLRPIAAFALRGITHARGSPFNAATPISSAERASDLCCKKASALASLVRLSLFTFIHPVADGELSWRRTSPLAGEVTPRGVSDGAASPSAQSINESKGRGLPVGPLASQDGGARCRSTSSRIRCATRTSCSRRLSATPVPARFAGALRLVPFRSCSRKSARNELAIASPYHSRLGYGRKHNVKP